MDDLVISVAKEIEIDDISKISINSFSDPWSRSSIKSEIDNDNTYFVVAKQNNKIIGYASMWVMLDHCEISSLSTHIDFRKIGIGKKLVENLIEFAKSEDVEYISLEVRESNHNAIRLYENCGFKRIGIRKNFYTSPIENGYIYSIYFK